MELPMLRLRWLMVALWLTCPIHPAMAWEPWEVCRVSLKVIGKTLPPEVMPLTVDGAIMTPDQVRKALPKKTALAKMDLPEVEKWIAALEKWHEIASQWDSPILGFRGGFTKQMCCQRPLTVMKNGNLPSARELPQCSRCPFGKGEGTFEPDSPLGKLYTTALVVYERRDKLQETPQ